MTALARICSGFTPAVAIMLAAGVVLPAGAQQTADPVVVDLPTRPGVTQRYLAIPPSGRPKAVVVLFAGGNGLLNIDDAQEIRGLRGNFLVRSRDLFRDRGLYVAVMDAPSDQKGPDGMGSFRTARDHAVDIGAVIADVRKRSGGVPVWLVGTSRGTISAVNGAARLKAPQAPDGLVLTSTLTAKAPGRNPRPGVAETVYDLDIEAIRVPTLIVYHRDDACFRTPPADVPALQRKLKGAARTGVIAIEGGLPPRSEACEAYAAHGFLGKEAETVDAIAGWILGGF